MTPRRTDDAGFDWAGRWAGPFVPGALGELDVHVWIASVAGSGLAADEAILADEERARASRLRHEADRGRYVAARCVLRRLLSGYLDELPGALSFRSGARGKPELDRESGEVALSFNLSHARDRVAVAIAKSMPVGVDIEQMPRASEVDDLARMVLSESEQAALAGVAPVQRPRSFLTAWVCKEAVLKALGRGLGDGARDVEVPGEVLVSAGESQGSDFDFVTECDRPWRVRGLQLMGDCVGAVAAPNADWKLRCLAFDAARR